MVVSCVDPETFTDPRHGGGNLKRRAAEDSVGVVTIDGIEYLHYKTPKSISATSGGNSGSAWKHYARKVPFLTICTETNPLIVACKDRKVTITSEGKIKNSSTRSIRFPFRKNSD